MPAIHASLSDEDFIDFAIMARAKGMTRTELAAHILIAEIKKQEKITPDEAEITFNSQGFPLAKKLKSQPGVYTTADGIPLVPMYERQ